jgi:large subunit ribosomal protein L25
MTDSASTTTPQNNTIPTEISENSNSVLISPEPLPSPYTPNRQAKGSKKQDPLAWSASKALLYSNPEHPNPFLPLKTFRNGRWVGPKYGLRQQADLVKLAKKYNVEALLPPGRKSTEFKETRRLEKGLRIKGIGIGQKVKGHKWERQMETKLEERRKAMLEMPETIRLWKQVRKTLPKFIPMTSCTFMEGFIFFSSFFLVTKSRVRLTTNFL